MKTALVLGATGSVGAAVAEALVAHGWKVRGLARNPGGGSLEWARGDAMKREDVVAAARGAQVIVHAVSPAGYRDWEKLVLPMMENTIAAAREAGARILLPGTVYNYDPAQVPVAREDSPQEPKSRKGRVRVELEQRLEAASRDGVQVLIVRAGDYFGPKVRSSWFGQAMVKPGQPVTRLTVLSRGVGHAWAYLPDLAEAMVRLLEAPGLRAFERVGFDGTWDGDGSVLPGLVAAALGRASVPTRVFPWWVMRLAAPFGGFPREAVDILPMWQHPLRIDNARLVELLGAEPRTAPVEAMRATLRGLGCMNESPLPLRGEGQGEGNPGREGTPTT